MNLSKHILFENKDFVVLNKPAGLLTIPDRFNKDLPCLSRLMEQKCGKIFVVHRLDKDTSGTLVMAKNENTHRFLSQKFQNREVDKFYLALAVGRIWEKEGKIDTPIANQSGKGGRMKCAKKGGLEALTTYEVIQPFSLYTLLKLQLFTGRTHQIRVHLQSIGHPIAMDTVYGSAEPFYLSSIKRKYRLGKHQEEEKPLMSRQALHASALHFTDEKGQKHEFIAPLPKDFKAVLNQLKKHAVVE